MAQTSNPWDVLIEWLAKMDPSLRALPPGCPAFRLRASSEQFTNYIGHISNFRQQFEAIVIGIIDGDTGTMSFNPSPTSPIRAGDILIVLGESDWIDQLQESVCVP